MIVRAAQTLGSHKSLADKLGVTTEVLADWIGGTVEVPDSAYFSAMDIVSNGPFNS